MHRSTIFIEASRRRAESEVLVVRIILHCFSKKSVRVCDASMHGTALEDIWYQVKKDSIVGYLRVYVEVGVGRGSRFKHTSQYAI